METIKCNLCQYDDYQLIYTMPDRLIATDHWFNVVECQNCGLGFVNPRPTFDEMSEYYPPTFYDYFEEHKDQHLRRYAEETKYVAAAARQTKGKLLDVGCANGDFPRYIKGLGWEVEGVEVSPNSKRIEDFKVYTSDFTQIPVDTQTYDVITAWAVLEHVHDPLGYFEKAARVLKTGGAFVFLVTNFNSISSRHLFLEDVPRHLYFFTEETIRLYLSKTGFEMESVDYSNKVYSMRPTNWLRHYFFSWFRNRNLTWKDAQESRQEFFLKNKLRTGLATNLKFALAHPLSVADRLLLPGYEWYQLFSRRYGIAIYTARRTSRVG